MLDFHVQHPVDRCPTFFGMSMDYRGLRQLQRVCYSLKKRKLTFCHTSFYIYIYIFIVAGNNVSVLILRNVSRLDSGRVDCSASNTLSTVNRQFLLSVKCKLEFSLFFL